MIYNLNKLPFSHFVISKIKKKMINYDKVWKYIQAPADFMRDGNREGIKAVR